jgi:UDP-N-acetylmuramyl pentapeptide phosphotransferase/UDP-N-acetylglucosamine-1-phosphate transferase
MATDPRNPTGGGIFIALGAAAGVTIGHLYAQTSIGLVAGVAAGFAIAGFLWWRERG